MAFEEIKIPKKCPNCGSSVMEFKGIRKDTGKPYRFWGCTNLDCRWIWKPPSKAEQRFKKIMHALRIIYAEIQKVKTEIKRMRIVEEKRDEEIPVVEDEEETEILDYEKENQK